MKNNIAIKKDKPSLDAPKLSGYDALLNQPLLRTGFYNKDAQILLPLNQTAASYLKTLEELGLLHAIKMGREQYYINKELVKVLSE